MVRPPLALMRAAETHVNRNVTELLYRDQKQASFGPFQEVIEVSELAWKRVQNQTVGRTPQKTFEVVGRTSKSCSYFALCAASENAQLRMKKDHGRAITSFRLYTRRAQISTYGG